MNHSIYRISLDIHDTSSQTSLSVKRGDTARSIYITLTDNSKPYKIAEGCTAVFRMKKPTDGNGARAIVYNDCTIEGNTICYSLTSSNSEVVGMADCEVTLYGADGGVLTSPHFTIIIDSTVNTDGEVETVGTNELTALVSATAEAKAITLEVEQKLANGDFVGEKGEKGDKGETGATGAQGIQGVKGDKGDKGDQGIQGVQGIQGIQGEKGEKGDKGEDANSQLFANAVIGSADGEAVRVDDVSPIEHHPLIKVKSKNLFNTSDDYKSGYDYSYSTSDRTLTVTGRYVHKFILLEEGKTYTFSCKSIRTGVDGGGIYLRAYDINKKEYVEVSGGNLINQLSPTVTFTMPTGYPYIRFAFYGFFNADGSGTSTYIDIMLEAGTKATRYVPCIDVTGVNVTRYGKNLLDLSKATFSSATYNEEANGITCKINNGYYSGVRVDYLNDFLLANKGKKLSFSIAKAIEGAMITLLIYGTRTSGKTNQEGSTTGKREISFAISEEFTEITGLEVRVNRYTSPFVDTTTVVQNMQVEVSDIATEFEKYIEGETNPSNADGTVEGITSLSPTMTLLTDTEGAVISCEYNRDTNKVVSSLKTADGTVVSQNADFAEVAEWADGNPDNEDRTGYFVCSNVPVDGIVMKKATSTDDVKGVTILAPAFAGNYSKDKVDSNGNLLPKYSYVAIIGFVPVIDNGTCSVGGRCMPDDNGCAIPSSNNMGYQVINRIDENRVLIIIEPNGDMVQRIKSKVTKIQEDIDDIKTTLNNTLANLIDVSEVGQ